MLSPAFKGTGDRNDVLAISGWPGGKSKIKVDSMHGTVIELANNPMLRKPLVIGYEALVKEEGMTSGPLFLIVMEIRVLKLGLTNVSPEIILTDNNSKSALTSARLM